MLAAHRGTADAAGVDWKSAVYRKVQEEVKPESGLTIERMVELGRVSRSGFYRFDDADRGQIRTWIYATRFRRSPWSGPATVSRGSPGTARRGWKVNPKRVYRLMREDNLLCVRKRKFVVTTDSNHGRKVYPNLAGRWS